MQSGRVWERITGISDEVRRMHAEGVMDVV